MIKEKIKSKKKGVPLHKKDEKLFLNLLKTVEQFMLGKNFSPLTEEELMQRLSLPPQHLLVLQRVLEKLVHSNTIEKVSDRFRLVKSKENLLSGTIHIHPKGFGFVRLFDTALYEQDIFIPKHLTLNAVDGDIVEIIVNPTISEKGPEGKVVAISERARSHLAGIIRSQDSFHRFIVYVPLLGAKQKVVIQPSSSLSLKEGDRLIMEVIEWGDKETETLCKAIKVIGHISDPKCDLQAAIEEFELRKNFDPEAIEEARSFGKVVSQKEIQKREDLRHLTSFTIDPDTAKDFDDALSLTKDSKGIYHLGVHIADVSYYVQPGSSLDSEAQLRCNSTYFPNYCLPMLPKELSENLCSLKADVNRLTVSVLMEFDLTGSLLNYRISRSVIKSAKRFTYREAKQVLDGKRKSKHLQQLELMTEFCKLLKKQRYNRGSIEFSLPELVILVDQEGKPYGTDYITYDITHQMVEEFMLKANEIIAFDLSQKGKNLTYRIHETPAEENLRDFSLLAAAFGFKIADCPSPQEIQKLFEEAEKTPYANYLASNYIRRMRLAVYSPENIGHYGLSLDYYCHFTSPIRRYVDLVVHRILFGESDDFSYLQLVAENCSSQERISAKAEMSVVSLKKLRLLNNYYETDPYRQYEAVITKVKNFGFYFDIIEFLIEGFIHISEIGDDYYLYDETKMRLQGKREGKSFSPGDSITVVLQKIDFILQDTKWYIIKKTEREPTLSVKKKSKPKILKKNPKSAISKEKVIKTARKPHDSKKIKLDAPKLAKKESKKSASPVNQIFKSSNRPVFPPSSLQESVIKEKNSSKKNKVNKNH